MQPMDRSQVRLFHSHAAADDQGYMPGTPEQRVLAVWDLTREAWALWRKDDAERRLQRNVAVLVRGKG
jgi:hypothetical protein